MRYGYVVCAMLSVLLTVQLSALACTTIDTSTHESEIPSPRRIIDEASLTLAALGSARFTLESEGKTSATFFGLKLHLIEGQVDMPDKFKARIEATTVSPRIFIELNVVGVGDQIVISDPFKKDTWIPVLTQNLAFNFVDLGHTLSGIIQAMEDPIVVGTESVDGADAWRIHGSVPSERLRGLLTSAESGHEVTLQFWTDKELGLLRKVQIDGQVFSQDSGEVIRNLLIYGFDEPMDISLPNILD